ncbi:MAG: dephospho-CoA kinase, partial [Pseudonocardiaceae bacterium]
DLAVARLTKDRGMDESDARRRIASQATRQERTAIADVIIVNDGSPQNLQDQVERWWPVIIG